MKLSSFKKSELDPNGDRGLTLGEITLLETFWMWIHYQKATNHGGRFNNSGRGGGGGRGQGHASRSSNGRGSNGRSGTWIPPEIFRSMSPQDQQAWIEFRSQQRRSTSNNVSSGSEPSSSRGNANSNGGGQQQSRINAALSSSANSMRTSSVHRYHLKGKKSSVSPFFQSLSKSNFVVNARNMLLVARTSTVVVNAATPIS